MSETPAMPLDIERYETVAETPELRVSVLTLAAGQRIPWHVHTHVTDTFFCLEGPMTVELRKPEAAVHLNVGESCAVPPGRPHHAQGKHGGPCRYVLVQGIGPYDNIPVDG